MDTFSMDEREARSRRPDNEFEKKEKNGERIT